MNPRIDLPRPRTTRRSSRDDFPWDAVAGIVLAAALIVGLIAWHIHEDNKFTAACVRRGGHTLDTRHTYRVGKHSYTTGDLYCLSPIGGILAVE